MSTMTSYKYVTYYMAHNGRSTIYPQIQAKVEELWADEPRKYRKALSLALYHSGRCCHRQGYFRWYMKDLKGNSVEGQTTEETRALLDQDCRKLVTYYEPTTVTCWYEVIRNQRTQDKAYEWGAIIHKKRAAVRAVNAAKVKAFKASEEY